MQRGGIIFSALALTSRKENQQRLSHLPFIIPIQLNLILYPMEQHCFQLQESHLCLYTVCDYLQLNGVPQVGSSSIDYC